MTGIKTIQVNRPKYINRRMYDVQRRTWRALERKPFEEDLVDMIELSKILKMSKGAIYEMVELGEFPSGQFRKGTKNAWKREFIEMWLKLSK